MIFQVKVPVREDTAYAEMEVHSLLAMRDAAEV